MAVCVCMAWIWKHLLPLKTAVQYIVGAKEPRIHVQYSTIYSN